MPFLRFIFKAPLLLGFLLCAAALGIAAYFQFFVGLEPCPLCILQRVAIFLVGLLFLVGFILEGRGLKTGLVRFLAGLTAIGGMAISLRHVWIQQLPADQVPTCGPGLSFMIDNFPLMDTLKMVLTGSGECAEVQWTLLGLSIPGWTAILLVGLMVLSWLRPGRRPVWGLWHY